MTACRFDRETGAYLTPDGDECRSCPFAGCQDCRYQPTKETR